MNETEQKARGHLNLCYNLAVSRSPRAPIAMNETERRARGHLNLCYILLCRSGMVCKGIINLSDSKDGPFSADLGRKPSWDEHSWDEPARIVNAVAQKLQKFPAELRLQIFRDVFHQPMWALMKHNSCTEDFVFEHVAFTRTCKWTNLYDWCNEKLVGCEIALEVSDLLWNTTAAVLDLRDLPAFTKCSLAVPNFKPMDRVRRLCIHLTQPKSYTSEHLGLLLNIPKLQGVCLHLDYEQDREELESSPVVVSLRQRGVDVRLWVVF
ncbi:hypothetical protein BU16DRAFT_48687 [Lophium mytilinum]|uniref:Uncharacterized protein n=1 Tax=Lophium mytilinum TaxID=390894 RepID=A0A6A6QRP7_9PEZI|nr:hypothetical protein BU16DRAFT_48687 [Lophium mytilinum]